VKTRIAGTLMALLLAPATAAAMPIPTTNGPPPAPRYLGHFARPNPIRGIAKVPQNPFMERNGVSEIHDDAWQTDTYTWGGPLGYKPHEVSSYLPPGHDCGSITFDSRGRVISICIGAAGPQLYMFDPNTLATLATFELPPRTPQDVLLNPNFFQDFENGGYFYLDNHDEVVTGTTSRHIYVIGENGTGFTLVHDYDLSSVLTLNEEFTSQIPDAHGLLWFTARQDGVVGTLDFATGAVHVIRLGNGSEGEITKSLASDANGGVYIPTNQKLYRFVAGQPDDAAGAHAGEAGRRARAVAAGVPQISWSVAYPNNGVSKPGQLDAGTGTTPVVSGSYVGIDDNADPTDVVIYRTSNGRQVCRVPVFHKGRSADENAMIAVGSSYLIENNYGYQNPANAQGDASSASGFARVDIKGCRVAWTNTSIHVPSVVSKVSLATGLVYTYAYNPGPASPWYWTALDYRTGRVVYKVLAGNGIGYNNNYSGIAISPSGSEYVGTLGGIILLRDGAKPPPAPASKKHKTRKHKKTKRPAAPKRRAGPSFTG
jgi:hypothetical protein